jgi:Tfp pilus assembly protein PilO
MKKEQQKYIFIGVGFVIFLFIYFNFLLRPINKGITEKRKKIEELSVNLNEAKKEAAQLEVLKFKLSMLETQFKNLQARLPKGKNTPDLLRTINKDAQRWGIKILSLQPRPMMPMQAADYDELTFSISYTGSFHSLGNFIADIGQEKRLFAVRELQMTQVSGDKMTTVSGTFVLIAYKAKGG